MSDVFREHKNYPYYISYYDTGAGDKKREFALMGNGNGIYACFRITDGHFLSSHEFLADPAFKDCFEEICEGDHHMLWIKPEKLGSVAATLNSNTKKVVMRNDQSLKGFNDFIKDVNQRTNPPRLLVCSVPHDSRLRSRL